MTDSATFGNPVVPGFHPDPSVCRVGEDYYLVCSSFEYFPGVPIFHSRDLVNWRQIGNVLDRPSQLELPPDTHASAGIYAPTIRHHDGRFYMVTTNVTTGRHLLVTATDPAGPWSEPVHLDVPHIDPSLTWDDNGDCWLTVSGVESYRIDPETGTVLEGPVPMWSGTGGQYPEAPHLYRIGDWWYLLVSEGGTHTGHAVSIARSRSIRGPFEPGPVNPFLTHRSTDRLVQATGHADLVQATDGSWWMVLLGIRAKGQWPPYHVLGRETFLVPVRWEDGWPVVDPVEETMTAPAGSPPALAAARDPGSYRDDFDATDALAPEWISLRERPKDSWSLTERPGWLTLHAAGTTLDRSGATMVARRQQHHDCRAGVHVDPGAGRAGLTLRIDEAHHYDIEVADGLVQVIGRVGPFRQVFGELSVPAGPVTLTITTRTDDLLPPTVTAADQVTAPGAPFGVRPAACDTVSFEVLTDDGPVVLAELDGRYLSTEVAAGFTGRVFGLYVTEGSAAFDWFDYRPSARP
ncbi:glycoside hydrolase 43 family protein [Verrucosispora sp. ts21]|uniref:glycoside hydrolase family 43 protein n=1 Tax=Verrucosispora sp. ts21 TaxID=2069341 RepID=UPI000C887BE2|nr:glycoside hydrolase family 43 protein [Verrucosispora sp. ts21]PMR62396.1 glycoside hydrolase 43 family protein [Verrucosispora sp. ts21]